MEGFIFYESFAEAINLLPTDEQLEAYKAIIAYGLYGDLPEFDSNAAQAIFIMAKPQMDANKKRRAGGASGGRPKKETYGYENEKPMVSETETYGFETEKPMVSSFDENEKPKEKVKEKVKVKDKEKESSSKEELKKESAPRFVRPSVDEVAEYCRERGNKVDAQQFVDFYASKGWKVGKEPMKDWKACVRTWEKRERARSGTNKFTAGIISSDYSGLREEDLIANGDTWGC